MMLPCAAAAAALLLPLAPTDLSWQQRQSHQKAQEQQATFLQHPAFRAEQAAAGLYARLPLATQA
jgi:hypothetical protein